MGTRQPPARLLSTLVDRIYACATGPDDLSELLALLRECLHGALVQLQLRQPGTGVLLACHSSSDDPLLQQSEQQYAQHWSGDDPRVQRLAALAPGEVLRCHEHFDDAFVAGNAFYQQFLARHGLRWSMAALFPGAGGTTAVICVARGPDRAPFEDWAAASLRGLLPHLQRASLIRHRLQRQAAAAQSTLALLTSLPLPCLVTDRAGRCIDANEAFRQAAPRMALHVLTGRVRFDHPDLQAQWETALFETDATGIGRTVHASAANAGALAIHLAPWDPPQGQGDEADHRLILALFPGVVPAAAGHPDQAPPPGGLTRAELEVFGALLKGLPAKAIANSRRASVNTVRSQIMAILGKTGFKSQKELIATFASTSFGESGTPSEP